MRSAKMSVVNSSVTFMLKMEGTLCKVARKLEGTKFCLHFSLFSRHMYISQIA